MRDRMDLGFGDKTGWECSCGGSLVLRKVAAHYLGSRFEVELPACAECGLILVPEGLAMGRMLEVEKILEDK
ncbi:MAG: DNA-binding protein [Synergistota bacterium]|nr:DNA-binding protein [Synergistota bacterium]